MLVILTEEDWDRWLSSPEERMHLLRRLPADQMEMWPVSKAVGSPRNDGPELIEPA